MPASSAPPLPSSAPSTLPLQSRLSRCDSHKWRTMLRLRPAQMALADVLHGGGWFDDPLAAKPESELPHMYYVSRRWASI